MAIDPLGTLIEQFSTIYDKINGENNKIAETVEEAKQATQIVEPEAKPPSMGDFRRMEEISKNPASQYGPIRTKQFQDELEDLQIEIDHYNNDYEQAIAEAEVFLKRELTDKLDVSYDEKLAILRLHRAKLQKAELDREDALDDIRDEVAEDFHSDFENQLAELKSDYKTAFLPLKKKNLLGLIREWI